MDDAIPIWLEYADGDLSTAEFLYDQQWPRQLEIICYHCQQAGEKAVKALYHCGACHSVLLLNRFFRFSVSLNEQMQSID